MSAFFSIVFQKVLNIDEFEAAKYARWVRMTYLDTERWRITNDAIPALNELGKLGWQHYMLTNHVPELGLILRNLLRKNYFLEVICSAEIGYEKPHPEAFKSVLKSIPEGATIWMIGDNYQADVIGAEKAGIPAILVRTYNPSAKFFSKKLNGVIEILQDNAKV
jgi:putative hydrolase of the HAD superfamily